MLYTVICYKFQFMKMFAQHSSLTVGIHKITVVTAEPIDEIQKSADFAAFSFWSYFRGFSLCLTLIGRHFLWTVYFWPICNRLISRKPSKQFHGNPWKYDSMAAERNISALYEFKREPIRKRINFHNFLRKHNVNKTDFNFQYSLQMRRIIIHWIALLASAQIMSNYIIADIYKKGR